jgi:hypothetical protein
MNIGIVIVATNSYFILGVRLIKRFFHFYKGDASITFFFFSDNDPRPYLQDGIHVIWKKEEHKSWQEGTNSKFRNILSLRSLLNDDDYLYYFDADTNIDKDFTEEWFIGDLVGGEHYANRLWMAVDKGYDRNPKSRAYIPRDTKLPQVYYYGAFFGGKSRRVLDFCTILKDNQLADKKINYEPGVNDESYINQYFHFHPPTRIIASNEFKFLISDKGGIGETRSKDLDINHLKNDVLSRKNTIFDIKYGKIV